MLSGTIEIIRSFFKQFAFQFRFKILCVSFSLSEMHLTQE